MYVCMYVCIYHVFPRLIKPSNREKLVAKRKFNNTMDKHAVKVVKGDETVGHLPCIADDAEEWRFHGS